MNAVVDQMQKAFENLIEQNPAYISFWNKKNDVNVLQTETVRISHDTGSVPSNSPTPVGLGTSYTFFAEIKASSNLEQNDVILFNGKGYKLGPVDELKVMTEVYGKRAPLTVVTPSAGNTITSFKIGSAVGTINNTLNTIRVIVPTGTDVTALTPVVVHTGKAISKSGVQDFTTPVEYEVTAENLETKEYLITVEVQA